MLLSLKLILLESDDIRRTLRRLKKMAFSTAGVILEGFEDDESDPEFELCEYVDDQLRLAQLEFIKGLRDFVSPHRQKEVYHKLVELRQERRALLQLKDRFLNVARKVRSCCPLAII